MNLFPAQFVSMQEFLHHALHSLITTQMITSSYTCRTLDSSCIAVSQDAGKVLAAYSNSLTQLHAI